NQEGVAIMKLFSLKSLVLTAAILVVGVLASPQQARADETINWDLRTEDSCNPNRPGCHEQLHKVYLQAGTTYNLDMVSNQFDTYLFLEDLNGNVLDQNDDYPGMGQNSRIVFTPQQSGYYNLVATTFQQGAIGCYTIRVTSMGIGGNGGPPSSGGTYYPPVV